MAQDYKRYERKERQSNLASRLGNQIEPIGPTERAPYDPSKQAEGIKTRLEGSGLPVEEVMDKRGPVEKALNLTEDQNAFFDFLEVLNRPQQAIFNAVSALQNGESFIDGFRKGLTGKDYTNFAKILNQAGLGDEDSFGVDDVLGFIGDVFLDPIDLAILGGSIAAAPVTGGTSLLGGAAVLKGANVALDAAQAANKALDPAQKLLQVSKTLGKSAQEAALNLGRRIKGGTKATGTLLSEVGKEAAKGNLWSAAKKLTTSKPLKLSNGKILYKTSVTNLVVGQFRDTLKFGAKYTNYVARTGLYNVQGVKTALEYTNHVAAWDDMLKAMQSTFDKAAKMGDKLFTEAQSFVNKKTGGIIYKDAWMKKVNGMIDDTTNKIYDDLVLESQTTGATVMTKDEVREQVLKELTEWKEYDYKPTTTVSDVLENPYDIPIDENVRAKLAETLNRPMFKDLRADIVSSPKRQRALAKVVDDHRTRTLYLIDNNLSGLEQERKALQKLAESTKAPGTEIFDPGQAGAGFVDNIKSGKPLDELLPKPKTATQAFDPGQAGEDFVGGVKSGKPLDELSTGAPAAQTMSVEQLKQYQEINDKITELEKFRNEIKKFNKGYRSADETKEAIQRLIDSGILDETTTKVLTLHLKQLDTKISEESLDFVSDLFKSDVLENGKRIFYFDDDIDVKKIISRIKDRVATYNKILSDNSIEVLSKVGRFAENSATAAELKTLIPKLNLGLDFEEIFELQNGMWIVKNTQAYDEVMKLARPEQLFSEVFESARFRTDEEMLALTAKYENFKYAEDYDGITNSLNDAMRWYDKRYGTKIFQETPGYLHHTVTKDMQDLLNLDYGYRNYMKAKNAVDDDWILVGNTKAFKARKYAMTVEEANMVSRWSSQKMLEVNKVDNFLSPRDLELWNKKATQNLFSEYFTDSFEDTLVKMNDYGSAINVMNTALISTAFNDKDTIRLVSKEIVQAGVPVSKGFQRVDVTTLREKIQRMTHVFEDNKSMKEFTKKFLAENTSQFVEIDKNVYEMIGRLGNTKDINGLVRMLDLTNASFKKLKIFSLGFHFKNLVGNASNLYLAGVPAHKIGPLLVRGIRGKKVGKEMLELVIKEGDSALLKMTPKQKKMYEAYQIFTDAGMEDAGRKVWDLDELMSKSKNHELSANDKFLKGTRKVKEGAVGEGINTLFDSALTKNIELNNVVDNGYRLGYIYEMLEEGLPPDEIVTRMKRALFDPTDLTGAERDIYRRLIPFYTFTKKNLAFQMRNVFENPVQYKRFAKSVRGSWEMFGVDFEEDLQNYQRENMWVPIPLTMRDGKYMQFKTSFPVSDLGEFLEEPVQRLLAAMTPFARAPFEYTTNTQVFSGMDIERFEGQRSRNLPFMGAKSEYVFSQTGLDRPVMAVKSVIDVLRNTEGKTAAPTVFSEGDVEQARISQGYDELNKLRDLLSYYKQEEIPVLTLSQIENINKPRANLSERLRNIQSRRER